MKTKQLYVFIIVIALIVIGYIYMKGNTISNNSSTSNAVNNNSILDSILSIFGNNNTPEQPDAETYEPPEQVA